MQKVALVIGASSESVFAIKQAQEFGLKVVAFDANQKAPGLGVADMAFDIDIKDPAKIIQTLNQNSLTPICVLPVPIGRYLITTGAINDHYGLEGPSLQASNDCTDKLIFHNKIRKALCDEFEVIRGGV